MKRIGGWPAGCFCPAACEVAAPNGKLKRRKTSNTGKSRYFRCNLLAQRTIKSPQLYMRIRLAIASGGSKPDFGTSRRPASSGMILFLPGLGEIHSCPAA
ncbi:hypothetical protein [Rhizobium sp. H4]|uniref:hypothetical protein n=1 Tax=Rhizobium sp. H4 TaxID=2035449 RepID=UPI001FDED68F|nr:hypothetical protein [Rhizobium sp. H4]